MASNFNFTTKIGLDSAGFKAGVNKVRGSLNSLKSSFLSLAGALGAGLGFTQLIANLKTTATELSVAMNTLKNVSYVTKTFKDGLNNVNIEVTNFQDNLSFVRRLASDYAQDLVAVTDNYAKFTAACKKTALSLEDQRMVFESLTKAAAYYHLSADRTADMMNAVVQMMSKGKVAAEELRRQLGNTLPGAFNMMAAAMGVSTAELDKLMRDGKVLAAEVLPKFAAMLNTVTATAEFDSLQSSMNKLKNAWYALVEKSGAEGLFKGVIDGSTKALTSVSDNIKGIKSVMVGLITYFASINLFSFFLRQGKEFTEHLDRDLKIAEKQLARFYAGVKELEKQHAVQKSSKGVVQPMAGYSASSVDLQKMQQYNAQLLQTAQLQHKVGIITKAEYDIIQREVNEATVAITGMNAATQGAAVSAGKLQTAVAGVGVTVNKAITAFTNFLKTNWIFLLISVVTTVWNYMKKIKDEAERIAKISEDYVNDIEVVKKTREAEAAQLKNNLEIVKDVNAAESARVLALKEINKALGLVGEKAFDLSELDEIAGKYDEITLAVERWIEATKKQAIIQAFAGQIADATAKKADAERRKKEKEAEYNSAKAKAGTSGSFLVDVWDSAGLWRAGGTNLNQKEREIRNITNEISEYEEAINYAETEMKKFGIELGDFFDILGSNGGGGGDLQGLAKIMDEYKKDTKELARQLKEGAITQEEYNEELNKLVQNTFKAAAATGEVSLEEIIKKQDKNQTLTSIEQWYLELKKQAIDCAQKVLLDGIAKSIIKDIDEALAEEAKELEKEFDKILENENKRAQINIDYAGATSELKYQNSRNKRDGTFDYKKSRADIFSEEANIANDNLDRVMDKIQELLDEEQKLLKETGQGLDSVAKQELSSLQEYYRQLAKEAKTIEEAYRFEQIREDIEDFDNQMASTIIGGIENFATSMDRVVSGAQQLRDIMENIDSTGWEKIMGVVNYIFNILNAFTSILETVNTLTEISNMLAGARSLLDDKKHADAAIELEGTVAQIAAEETLAGVKAKEAAFETAITSNKIAQAEASLGVATALGIETAAWIALSAAAKDAAMAIAAANAAAAAGPAAPAAALAAATSVGAGLTATMAAFAKGGIVGGNSTHGDRNLARVNSGEMILNKAQQGTLFSMLNGKGGLGGNVEFKIRGADLVGTINNHMSRKRG